MKQACISLLSLAFSLLLTQLACQKSHTDADRSSKPYASSLEVSTMLNPSTQIIETDSSSLPYIESSTDAELRKIIPRHLLQAARKICADQRALSEFPLEMSTICLDGQASAAFAEIIANANRPESAVQEPMLIKSESIEQISYFLIASSVIVNTDLQASIAKRSQLNAFTASSDDVSVQATQIAAAPGDGYKSLGTYEVREETTARLGLIVAHDTKVLSHSYAELDAAGLVAVYSQLKPDAPENKDNLLSNRISFWIKDGEYTRILNLSQIKVNDRGLAEAVEQSVLNLSQAALSQSAKILSTPIAAAQ